MQLPDYYEADVLRYFDQKPQEAALYEALFQRLCDVVPDASVKVQKSQISFYGRHLFAAASIPVRRKRSWPEHCLLVTFGLAFRLDSPRIGLANVGTEDEKGNVLTHETFPLLKARTDINFVGNLEGRDVFDKADVIVSDGFAGNLLLKSIEGTASFLMGIIKKEFSSGLRSKMGAGLLMPYLKRIKKMMDYTEYGGAPLLGIDGVIIKGHGSSNAKAVRAAVRQCVRMINADVVEIIKERLSAVEI